MSSPNCPFCAVSSLTLVAENELAIAIRDKFPIRPLHTLVIPKRHVADIFEASAAEREAVHELASRCRTMLMDEDPTIGGFNVGSNIGEAAGQKIFHAHLHLIPRRVGDTPPPPARPVA
ncbi:histidine triad (HIT) protein [Methylosinus sp. R-45379]|jgi:diadenosine tetraphosphate (Ap4A) HIT family hydrolase|uniref:HIT family protein n=1 Tax=unclassified Methylosinus TaxID=2624500 RepID=UPI0004669946|nr:MULTISPECIES: HIT family protein [unclassified Methylosinus]OAI30946.1 histidine triad (HIT) protein [Methylosinus sp. R-45379]